MASIPGGVGAHHRHIHPYNNNNKDEQKHHSSNKQDEQSPLVLLRHFSMAEEPPQEGNNLTRMYHRVLKLQPPQVDWKHWGFLALFFLLAAFSLGMVFRNEYGTHQILRIEHAREHFVSVDDGIQIWFRTWGNRQQGIPILFVHGGPGNAIADYNNGNQEFFDYRKYFVVEVDQRYVRHVVCRVTGCVLSLMVFRCCCCALSLSHTHSLEELANRNRAYEIVGATWKNTKIYPLMWWRTILKWCGKV
jgi:hypothetical protein